MHPKKLSTIKKMAMALCLLGANTVFAGDLPSVLAFEEGEQFKVALSRINFNRVFVEGESIIKLSYPEQALTVDKSEMDKPDSKEASVYIKPNFETPITLFITTDKGHHLSLTLSPDESAGKTLRLALKTKTKLTYVKADVLEPESAVDVATEAMAAMKEGQVPNEFKVEAVKPRPFYLKKDIKVSLEKQYLGKDLMGYVYKLENRSNHEIEISTDLFANNLAKSLSLSQEHLAPKEVAYLYGLYGNQG